MFLLSNLHLLVTTLLSLLIPPTYGILGSINTEGCMRGDCADDPSDGQCWGGGPDSRACDCREGTQARLTGRTQTTYSPMKVEYVCCGGSAGISRYDVGETCGRYHTQVSALQERENVEFEKQFKRFQTNINDWWFRQIAFIQTVFVIGLIVVLLKGEKYFTPRNAKSIIYQPMVGQATQGVTSQRLDISLSGQDHLPTASLGHHWQPTRACHECSHECCIAGCYPCLAAVAMARLEVQLPKRNLLKFLALLVGGLRLITVMDPQQHQFPFWTYAFFSHRVFVLCWLQGVVAIALATFKSKVGDAFLIRPSNPGAGFCHDCVCFCCCCCFHIPPMRRTVDEVLGGLATNQRRRMLEMSADGTVTPAPGISP